MLNSLRALLMLLPLACGSPPIEMKDAQLIVSVDPATAANGSPAQRLNFVTVSWPDCPKLVGEGFTGFAGETALVFSVIDFFGDGCPILCATLNNKIINATQPIVVAHEGETISLQLSPLAVIEDCTAQECVRQTSEDGRCPVPGAGR